MNYHDDSHDRKQHIWFYTLIKRAQNIHRGKAKARPSGTLTPFHRSVWLIETFLNTLVPRFGCNSHKNLVRVVSLSEARQQIMMVKMAGDLDGLLENFEMMRKIPKALLMK